MTLLRNWERLPLWQQRVRSFTGLVPMLKKVRREKSALQLLWLVLPRPGRELSWGL